jgi:hypothetical protein
MKYGLFNILLAGWALSLNSSSLAQTPQEIVEGQLAQAEQSLGPARMTSALHDTLTRACLQTLILPPYPGI